VLEPLLPCCRHWSRSLPVRPTHWLLEEPLPELLPPEAEPPLLAPGPLLLVLPDPGAMVDPDEPLPGPDPMVDPDEPLDPDPMVDPDEPPLDPEPVLDPDEPPLAPELEEPPLPALPPPLDCAQATPATPTSAAVTAAPITFSFTMSLLGNKKGGICRRAGLLQEQCLASGASRPMRCSGHRCSGGSTAEISRGATPCARKK
jgi:hypothetical protein